jgi:hypothetical protein
MNGASTFRMGAVGFVSTGAQSRPFQEKMATTRMPAWITRITSPSTTGQKAWIRKIIFWAVGFARWESPARTKDPEIANEISTSDNSMKKALRCGFSIKSKRFFYCIYFRLL